MSVLTSHHAPHPQEKCHQYWPAERSARYQYFVVDPMAEYNMPQYILREFKVTDARVSVPSGFLFPMLLPALGNEGSKQQLQEGPESKELLNTAAGGATAHTCHCSHRKFLPCQLCWLL